MPIPTRNRIKGKALTFKIGTVDYYADATSIDLTSEESASSTDTVTFCDAANAVDTRDWYFDIESIITNDADSLWTYLWDNSGTQNVAYTYAPHGNTTPSATQPHFTGFVNIPSKPNIGGSSNSTWTFKVRIDCTAEPTKKVAP